MRLLEDGGDRAVAAGLDRPRPRRGRVPGRRRPLPAVAHRRCDRALRQRARADRAPRRASRTGSGPTSSTGGPAAIAGTATGWRPRRTSSGRSSSPRRAPTRAGSRTRSSRRRSSRSARARGCSRAPQAERARDLFASLGDRATVARLLNNLAGLNHLLGQRRASGRSLLEEAFEIFVEPRARRGRRLRVLVARGDPARARASAEAEAQARKALDLLGGRVDHLQEIGTAQLALGRALAAQGSLDEGETSHRRTRRRRSSARSRRATASSAWIAQGDVESTRQRRGRGRPLPSGRAGASRARALVAGRRIASRRRRDG